MIFVIFLIGCNELEKEQAEKLQIEKAKQDSIQMVLESLRQRELAAKNLKDNVTKMCQLQLLALENGAPDDSLRLQQFTVEMKELYPNSDRKVLRRMAMNIDSCEEYRQKAGEKRKK